MSPLIAVAILAFVAVLVPVLLYARSARGRQPWIEDVPSAQRPGYSDEELEGKIRVRYLTWGLMLTVFFALALPLYWINEQRRLDNEVQGFFTVSVERGETLYTENCAQCHGADLGGGGAASPYNPDENWPAPNLTTIAARYEDNPNITDIRQYIVNTLEVGRPGTPMPTWGAAYGGPWNDQQIEEVTDFILSRQVDDTAEAQQASALDGQDLFEGTCARCHGPDGRSGGGRPGPSLVGVFERHSRESILGILRNGIYLGTGVTMPPWQNGYFYPTSPGEDSQPAVYEDTALNKVIDYLETLQPEELPPTAGQYHTPGVPQSEIAVPPADDPATSEGDV
ncbi:MAG: cytochrome c [Actinobacteria bacterium]|nr:cytochrome c [Actinomycetota bacterium]